MEKKWCSVFIAFRLKRILLAGLVILFFSFPAILLAQLLSPEAFLGYPLGSRFTSQEKILDYCRHLESYGNGHVRVKIYGQTPGHRPLFVCFVSSQSNLEHLDAIKRNNRMLACFQKGHPDYNAPVVLWYSYNVHGNEPSCSEAALAFLYQAACGMEPFQSCLRNCLIIVDPCVNPDGRARYINWFEDVSGNSPNLDSDAIEHHEPWPGGRYNHYYFDLNRDWVWQSQPESQQRLALYQDYLPQVHADFHEQEIGNPYYFPPAAHSYHDLITPWQRSFQQIVGNIIARDFDQKGWLYFTKEEFDLFYPSYGDSYPLFNGAVGMTFEQAGNSHAGLRIVTPQGNKLNLSDRIAHHLLSSIDVMRAASLYATDLLENYHHFFSTVPSNITYKTYIVKYRSGDEERIRDLKALLRLNGIWFGSGSGEFKGVDFNDFKVKKISLTPKDLLISIRQPKGVLASVLFEPRSRLEDSLTYDITSWALPYVYGLQGFAVKNAIRVTVDSARPQTMAMDSSLTHYGYAIRWQGPHSARVLTGLLKLGITVRFSDLPFSVGGENFSRGTLLILRDANMAWGDSLWYWTKKEAASQQVPVYALDKGMVDKGADFGSPHIHVIKAPKIAVVSGKFENPTSIGEIWYLFDHHLNYPVSMVSENDLEDLDLDKYQILILPSGDYPIGEDKYFMDRLLSWIKKGGKLICMEDAIALVSSQPWSGLHERTSQQDLENRAKANAPNSYDLLSRYGDRDRKEVSSSMPGAIFRVDLDNTHPLMYGYGSTYYTLKQNSTIYNFIGTEGWNAGIFKKNAALSGFIGYDLQKKLSDGLLFGNTMIGKGTLVFFTDDVLFRDYWNNGKLMFINAVFLVGQ